jgi:hypothetical protein
MQAGGIILPVITLLASFVSLFTYGWLPAAMMLGWFIVALIVSVVFSTRVSQLVFQQVTRPLAL